MLDFAGLAFIVTGGANGLGRAYARLLASRGASVLIADLGCARDGRGQSSEAVDHAVADIAAAGGTAGGVVASVATEAGAAAIVDAAMARFGRIDGVVNNAGFSALASFEETPPGEFRRNIEVHYYGTVNVSRAAWPHLERAGQGRIVNILSPSMLGIPGFTPYAGSKGAIYALTRCLAAEGAARGIRVNAVSPAAATRQIYAPGLAETLPEGAIAQLEATMPPEAVAPVIAYLLHPATRVTGQAFSAGGGAVSRLVMMSTPGIASDALTPELIAERLADIMRLDGAVVAQLPGHEFDEG